MFLKSIFTSENLDERSEIVREWDRLRAAANSANERSEIDAIFSRSL